MRYRSIVGGITFATHLALPALPKQGFSDDDCTVEFIGADELQPLISAGAIPVAGPANLVGVVNRETDECWIVADTSDPDVRAWHLRQLAPIFSAAFGRVVLHAAAVAIDNQVIGFIGTSGVGKSTLAAAMADLGHVAVSDDLLPIRFRDRPLAPIDTDLRPIGALCFLQRSDRNEVQVTALDALAALNSQIENGFGEHYDPTSWAVQFDGYHRLVEAVPHFTVTIPDGLEALPANAMSLDSHLRQHADTAPINGGS